MLRKYKSQSLRGSGLWLQEQIMNTKVKKNYDVAIPSWFRSLASING